MTIGDIVRVGCVSKEWRGIVKNNPVNSKRVKHIKVRRHAFETSKENHGYIHRSSELRRKTPAPLDAKQEVSGKATVANDETFSVFCAVDINTLNQAPVQRLNLERKFKVNFFSTSKTF